MCRLEDLRNENSLHGIAYNLSHQRPLNTSIFLAKHLRKDDCYATSRKLARPRLNAPPHPTPSDCALFVLFCALVINICACMVTFLFYVFLGPANFTPAYPHKDI